MNVSELISKIAECLIIVTIEHRLHGDEKAEEFLRRLQLLWNKERPLTLHTLN